MSFTPESVPTIRVFPANSNKEENKMSVKALRNQLIAAIAMVLVATIALGSSTYAWFAANNEVTATGMNVTAQGESGIVIKGASDDSFTTTGHANAAVSSLLPTSSNDLTNWWHARSAEYDDENDKQDAANYTDVTANKGDYVAQHDFIIRSAAAGVPLTGVKLAVKSVSITPPATVASVNLDKAIRVGVKINGAFYIYAPSASENFTLTANYASGATLVEKKTASAETDLFTLTDNTVPANDTGLTASVFVWYEGEDVNCKSSNLTATIDQLGVTVVFTTVPVSTT